MDNTQQPIENSGPKARRSPEEDFESHEDFKLYEMACDQIEAGENLEFYLKPANTGWAMLTNGGRKQYFMK